MSSNVKLKSLKANLKSYDVNSCPFTMGRNPKANIILRNVMFSREHCVLEKDGGEWVVKDLSSSGTFLNGELIGKNFSRPLKNGSVIRLGPVEEKTEWEFCEPTKVQTLPERKTEMEQEIRALVAKEQQAELAVRLSQEAAEKRRVDEELALQRQLDEKEKKELEERLNREAAEKLKMQEQLEAMQRQLDAAAVAQSLVEEQLKEEEQRKLEAEQSKREAEERLQSMPPPSAHVENFEQLLEAEMQCSICSELFIKATTLNCTHTFCAFCLHQWKAMGHNTCPICRANIKSENRALAMDNMIDKMVENLSEEFKRNRQEAILARSCVDVPPPPPPPAPAPRGRNRGRGRRARGQQQNRGGPYGGHQLPNPANAYQPPHPTPHVPYNPRTAAPAQTVILSRPPAPAPRPIAPVSAPRPPAPAVGGPRTPAPVVGGPRPPAPAVGGSAPALHGTYVMTAQGFRHVAPGTSGAQHFNPGSAPLVPVGSVRTATGERVVIRMPQGSPGVQEAMRNAQNFVTRYLNVPVRRHQTNAEVVTLDDSR